MKMKEAGKTKSVGYEIGVRKTFQIPLEKAWKILFSEEGIHIWLGDAKNNDIKVNQSFSTSDGIAGQVRVLKPFSHLRMSWQKEHWKNVSTLQIRITKIKSGTTISFHQEKLLNSDQRHEMRKQWKQVLDQLSEILKNSIGERYHSK
jgi:uncharacterized protein YndB with AHSA1/START domain